MTFWPLLVCTLLYLVTAVGFWRDGNVGLADRPATKWGGAGAVYLRKALQ